MRSPKCKEKSHQRDEMVDSESDVQQQQQINETRKIGEAVLEECALTELSATAIRRSWVPVPLSVA